MYLTPTKRHWIVDIEADDLRDAATVVWVVCIENAITGEKITLTDYKEIREWFHEHRKEYFVGHNFIGYDAPVLNKLVGTRIGINSLVDTFVLSMLFSPSLKGGHSLDAWGERLKFPKIEFNDFSCLSDEMITYCQQDVALTKRTFILLTKRMREVNFSEKGAELEHHSWHIIQNKQRRRGFPFDYKRAHELYVKLRQREDELKEKIYETWPPQLIKVAEYAKAKKRDGSNTANFDRHMEQYPKIELREDGGYDAFDWVEFNLGSSPQRVAKLSEAGWKPTTFTPAGNPKVDEESLIAFAEQSGNEAGTLLAKWIVINSRANMINTWLNAYNEKTGAIHGNLWLASTLRYRHDNPNTANIPAVRLDKEDRPIMGEEGSWTYEARDLWTCGSDDYVLIGIDGTGIQNRCLVHNLIETVGPKLVEPFKQLSLSGDIHKHNIEVLGLANKAAAKKFYYTLMMGGAGARLAADQTQFGTYMTAKEGDEKKNMLIASIPGFSVLIGRLKQTLKRTGRIVLCDGTPIIVTSPHMVIPYLLQGDESRLMKQAAIYVDEEIRRYKFDAFKVGDIHDEWQIVCKKDQANDFIEKALPCFIRAGETFDYKIPIEGDFKIGRTWAETH